MAPKLTHSAAEILNDILLHTLQQNGIEKAEIVEQLFFDVFSHLGSIHNAQSSSIMFTPVSDFTLVYKMENTIPVILTITHSSRLSQTFNALSNAPKYNK